MEADEEYDDLFDDDLFHHPLFTQVCSLRPCAPVPLCESVK